MFGYYFIVCFAFDLLRSGLVLIAVVVLKCGVMFVLCLLI